jgi:hypothetical protein
MSERTAVLVTGSRHWRDPRPIQDRLVRYPAGTILIHGDCGERIVKDRDGNHIKPYYVGADKIAGAHGRVLGFNEWRLPYFGDLKKLGGPKRNEAMVRILAVLWRAGFACFVEGFPIGASVGTRGCLRIAHKASSQLLASTPERPDGAFSFFITEGVQSHA